jgi:SAM-dependent methyltransferase
VQVLEHVFEPLRMVEEIGRVLRPGGHAIFLIPQTSTTHLAPHYHCNFSRYWIEQAMPRAGLEIVEQRPLGGRWSSTASHMLYFFLQAFRFDGMSGPEYRRNALFWLMLPFMMLWALVSIPVCLVFSLGDLSEEPNNHLVVARRRGKPAADSSNVRP